MIESRENKTTATAKEILKELILKTESKDFKWTNTVETSDRLEFKYLKKITEKKNLIFELTIRRRLDDSDLTIRFGPVKNSNLPSFLYYITTKTQSTLHDLIFAVNKKHNDGETLPEKKMITGNRLIYDKENQKWIDNPKSKNN